ncbi:TetR/AcrR family transcriptional regulator [Streptomyces nodosus]|uniref:TetR/AcrR family transcriptional regulator n=1 Tax=Streptomyces nodosus TaxID=40318 RepID=UPI0036E027A4
MITPRQLARPPVRADARRNYEALVAAAEEVFTAEGPDAPLDVIARRAGVGNATLYRHFPTRRDLLVAVSVGEVETLCELAERLRAEPNPRDALIDWIRAYIDHVSAHRGLGAALNTGTQEDDTLVAVCQAAVTEAGSALLEAAVRSEEVRGDLRISDLLALVGALATASENGDQERPERLLRLVIEGIAG